MFRSTIALALAASLAVAGCQTRPAGPPPRRPDMLELQLDTVVARPGDTIERIAEEKKVALRALIGANSLTPPYRLHAGQVIVLPYYTHVAAAGETLDQIADWYRIDRRSLRTFNPTIRGPLLPGTTVRLPARPAEPGYPPQPRKPVVVERRPAPRPFDWPAAGRLVGTFGPKGGDRRNDGVDIAVREGDPVRAAAGGVVVFAGEGPESYGRIVILRHADGWRTVYAHNSRILVEKDQEVGQGRVIAEAGATGDADSPLVHFEVWRGRQAVDPITVLPARSR